MDVLTFEICWAVNSEIIKKWHQVDLSLFNYQDNARSNKHKVHKLCLTLLHPSFWSSEQYVAGYYNQFHVINPLKTKRRLV